MKHIIGIAGAGGIGSNVARYLAQAGVERIRVADHDRVEVSNLDRQFYRTDQVGQPKVDCLKENLVQINPDMRVETVCTRVAPGQGLDLFKDCCLVVEGFDDPVAKKSLVEDIAPAGIPMVCASGIAGRRLETVAVRQVGGCHIVGDFATDVLDGVLFPPKVGLIAAIMAGLVLDLAGKETV